MKGAWLQPGRALGPMLALGWVFLLLMHPMASAASPGFSIAAAPPDVRVSERFDGRSVQLVRGQDLLLTLPSNPTTGYGWQVGALDPGVLKESQVPQQILGRGGLGAAGVTQFRFQAVGAGRTTLQLNYRRGFEAASIPPVKRFTLQVLVR